MTFLVSQLLQWLPLFTFMLYPRFREMSVDVWQEAFYASSICAIIVTFFLIYKNVILDRLRLGISLFLVIGALAFLFDAQFLLYFYEAYKGAVFCSAILIIGIVMTLFSPLGFIGVDGDKQAIKYASLQLLGVAAVALVWAFFTNDKGLFISAAVPFIGLRMYRLFLIKKFENTQA